MSSDDIRMMVAANGVIPSDRAYLTGNVRLRNPRLTSRLIPFEGSADEQAAGNAEAERIEYTLTYDVEYNPKTFAVIQLDHKEES